MAKIGILVGNEKTWLSRFMEEVNRTNKDVEAEVVLLGGTHVEDMCEYDVIVDRLSQRVPYYRTFLKTAVLSGTKVVNNPFWENNIDSFLITNISKSLKINQLRTVALPSHAYDVGSDSLGNLLCPLPWQQHIEYLGDFPVVLRPAWNGGNTGMYQVIRSYEDLWRFYNQTGTHCMMLQERLLWENYARCMVAGDQVVVLSYDPQVDSRNRYSMAKGTLTDKEQKRVSDLAKTVAQMVGYDACAIDFAWLGNKFYLMDIVSPIELDTNILPTEAFDQIVKAMATMAVGLAKTKRQPIESFSWTNLANLAVSKVATKEPAKKSTASSTAAKSSSTAAKSSSTAAKSSSTAAKSSSTTAKSSGTAAKSSGAAAKSSSTAKSSSSSTSKKTSTKKPSRKTTASKSTASKEGETTQSTTAGTAAKTEETSPATASAKSEPSAPATAQKPKTTGTSSGGKTTK